MVKSIQFSHSMTTTTYTNPMLSILQRLETPSSPTRSRFDSREIYKPPCITLSACRVAADNVVDLGSAVDTIDAVGLGCVLGGGGQDTELTAGGGVVEGLASGGGVVDVGGDFDIIGRTQAGLVVGRETPRVGTTVLGDGNGVVTGSCCINDLTINGGDLGGGGEDARRTTLVLDGVLVGEVGDLDSHLMTVNASPCQAVTSVSDGDGVVTTALNAGDGLVGEAFHKLGAENNSIIISCVVGDTSLSIVVETPSPDAAPVVDGE